MTLTTEQIQGAANKLELLTTARRDAALRMLRDEHLCALDLVLEGRNHIEAVAADFAKGVEVTVPGRPDLKGELFVTGRRKAAEVVDLRPYGAREGWSYHDGWDVVWGDNHNRRQAWFSNDEIATAQVDGEWI